jgi:hypothetical protein
VHLHGQSCTSVMGWRRLLHLHLGQHIRRKHPLFSACFLSDLIVYPGRRFMQALHEDAEADGARILFNMRVLGADVTGGSTLGDATPCICLSAAPLCAAMASCAGRLSAGQRKAVYVEHMMTGERQMLHADCVINAAGLWAQVISL